MTELAFHTIAELAALLERGAVSAEELAQDALLRLERDGGPLGALAALTPERALAAARRADRARARGASGPLLGIPYGAKDIIDVRGLPTTCGTAALADEIAAADAAVVTRLERAGAVLAGKLALAEAIGLLTRDPCSSLQGPARNPWAPERWAGGSSGGSGAAVAAGLLPAALGSETAGSIGSPAAWCGVTGVRPSYGVVSRRGVAPLAPTLDKVGVLGRSAQDCALVLDAISGRDRAEHASSGPRVRHAQVVAQRAAVRGLRIGWSVSDVEQAAPVAQRACLREALAALRAVVAGPLVEGVALPEPFPYRETLDTIMGAEGAAAFSRLRDDGRLALVADERTRVFIEQAPISARDYLAAREARRELVARIPSLFDACDVVVTTNFALPWPIPAIDVEWDPIPIRGGNTAMVWASNLTGLPAVFLPVGLADGMPVGVQLVGPVGSDARVLALATAFQEETTWHRLHPPIGAPA
ncbi:MAG TPA: amidase [Conexibacter sp.]|jgi:aspartyl-tRNA(Asn)/glutamyl-tRNA(Gln) amidotransferase subunit A|nr:amidase [Conexibacter sp.]